MIVVQRFRLDTVDPAVQEEFRDEAESALGVLAQQRGYVDGHLGHNADDPTLWVLQTLWEGPGAYRRALSAYEVKLHAWQLLGKALDEPSAYELVRPGEPLNQARPRGG